MAELRTLQAVVSHVDQLLAGGVAAPATPAREEHAAPRGLEPQRWVLQARRVPASGLGMDALYSGVMAVVGGTAELRSAVVGALTQHGIEADAQDEPEPGSLGGLIDLSGMGQPEDIDAALESNRQAFRHARAAAPSLANGGAYVVVGDTGGSFGLTEAPPPLAWTAGLVGLARTAAHEWPKTSVKAVDLERGSRGDAELARVLVDELVSGGPELEVGLPASGGRLVLSDASLEPPSGTCVLKDGDVVVVSGGARGVTATTMVALAETARLRFLLLGRTSPGEEPACCKGIADEAGLKRALLQQARSEGRTPTPLDLGREVSRIQARREIDATLAAIAAAGSEARYESVDIGDPEGVAAAVASARERWGRISAVVHGAGVIADKAIAEKTDEQFARVFDTKVLGLRNLLSATAGDELRALCLFSSVSARCGNAGQCDYAMANQILNVVGELCRRSGVDVVRSLGWGPWEGGMVTPALKKVFESRGVPLIPLETGARMLVDELKGGGSEQVQLVLGGDPATGIGGRLENEEVRYSVQVNGETHPYLVDHSINGTPIVPVVLAIEWFGRAARAIHPDLQLAGLRGLKVLKGIPVSDLARGLRLRVVGRPRGEGRIDLELSSPDGPVHYRATAEMVGALPESDADGPEAPLELSPWTRDHLYGEELFHGPRFQVIRAVEGISDGGMAASLAGVSEMGWDANGGGNGNGAAPASPFRTDPAALDGGLQLAVLWFNHMLGGASLPTAIDFVRTYEDHPVDGEMRAVLRGRQAKGQKAVSDVALRDGSGRLLTVLEGVEVHRRPDKPRG